MRPHSLYITCDHTHSTSHATTLTLGPPRLCLRSSVRLWKMWTLRTVSYLFSLPQLCGNMMSTLGGRDIVTRAYVTMQIASLLSNIMNIHTCIAEILYDRENAVHRDGVSLFPDSAEHEVHTLHSKSRLRMYSFHWLSQRVIDLTARHFYSSLPTRYCP